MRTAIGAMTALALAGCATHADAQSAAAEPPPADETQITLGNGERNAIQFEGASRSGSVFTFPSVTIERDGWLVMHPFRDGAPVRDEYVGHSFVPAGTQSDVAIEVSNDPQAGTMYIVMLHFDMVNAGVFDFGDGITVPDAPAFEGTTMIAHAWAAPAGN